jgi:NAD(P)-dependent dehydrogenase (short-subunit alcohol dehydrogenase family)
MTSDSTTAPATDTRHAGPRLDGRIALVTGASRGLGRDIARALASAGADVVVTARTADELEATADDIRSRGVRGLAVPGDVSVADDVRRVRERAEAELGPVDIVVNNAGNLLYKPLVPLPGMPPQDEGFATPISDEEWHSVFRTHVDGAFHTLREFAPGMLERRHGRVVNIVSNVLGRIIPFCSAYDAAKGALAMMTRSYATEWARSGITVNAVAPGHYPSAMTERQLGDDKLRAWVLGRIPMRRVGEPAELASLVVYLASDAAAYLTGEVITMDGGATL